MNKFRTLYDEEKVCIPSCSGNPMVCDYESIIDDDGTRHLEIVGQHSIYDEIQSYHDYCDLNKIIERFKLTGDVSLIQQKQGFYADVTEYPKTMAEMLQLSDYARNMFESLPAEEREIFNNNIEEFLVSMSTKDSKYNQLVEKYNKVQEIPPVESEVANE